MIYITRIYDRKKKTLVKQITGKEDPQSIFRDWLIKKRMNNQTIESLLIDSSNKFIAFYHIITDKEIDMKCGKVEVIIKNKKPHILEESTNLLFEFTCTCCSEIQSIARCMVLPEFNNKYYQYYFNNNDNSRNVVSILNKFEFLFLENNYWQKLLLKEMKKYEANRLKN